jgi:hypothetical protein
MWSSRVVFTVVFTSSLRAVVIRAGSPVLLMNE